MFESVKSYVEGLQSLTTWLDVEAFKHKNGQIHPSLRFLQYAHRPVYPDEDRARWILWNNPVPNIRRAKDSKTKNVPPPKEEQSNEFDIEVEESQYSKKTVQQKLDCSLQELVEDDASIDAQSSVSSSISKEKK